jgi:hypothetical protein
MCFTNKQISHSILSGAYSLASSAPLMCLGSYLIALGPTWPRILYHLVAVAPTSLWAI